MKILNFKIRNCLLLLLSIAILTWFSRENSKNTLNIHVFAWKRAKSLSRLLNSLNNAEYLDDRALLIIHVDGEESEDVDRVIFNFKWKFGRKFTIIQRNKKRLGLLKMMLYAWDTVDSEYAIFLEDDVQVSDMFYIYAKKCINLLQKTNLKNLIGCSLYTPRLDEICPTNDPQHPPLWNFREKTLQNWVYYQLPCSWGAVYKDNEWKKFTKYLDYRIQSSKSLPEIPNSRSNKWESSWKRFLIEFMVAKGLFLLYPNFKDQVSFSTNYYEEGIHSVPPGVKVVIPDRLRAIPDERFQVPLFEFKEDLKIFTDFPEYTDKIPLISIYNQVIEDFSEFLKVGNDWIYSVYNVDKRAYSLLCN